MGFEETGYVYKITVDGTGIQEYYDLDRLLEPEQVEEIWLSDAEANHGGYLPELLGGRVNVELLTEVDDSQEPDLPEEEPIPLPPPDEEKDQ